MNEADVFQWLESSPLAVYIRQSYVLYPVTEIVHIIGFIFLTGSAFLFDFRLLGLSKKIPVNDLATHLLPWARRSLFLVIPSGILLFITQATSLSTNNIFKLKLLLIIIALTNAAYFHRFTFRSVNKWNTLQPPSPAARAAGIISLLVWTGVITCGRFLAYFE
jgi:hypothetical protein